MPSSTMLRSEGCTEAQGYLLGRPAFGITDTAEIRAA
jgi:EAL domain-containing protein (putative c-di-GMP-specific phosphodiesterase class I)